MVRKKIEIIEAPKVKKTKARIALNATLGVCIPEALNKKIVADAKKKKIKKSELVRSILEAQYSKKSA